MAAALPRLARLVLLLAKGAFTLPTELTSDQFDAHVGGNQHTLVEFFAPWCSACTSFAPALHAAAEQLEHERRGDVQLVRVDGDAESELRVRFQIQEAPSILLFPASVPADLASAVRYDGALEQAPLLAWAREELGRFTRPRSSQPRRASKPTTEAKMRSAVVAAVPPAFNSITAGPILHGTTTGPILDAATAGTSSAPSAADLRQEEGASVTPDESVARLSAALLELLRVRRGHVSSRVTQLDHFASVDAELMTVLERRALIDSLSMSDEAGRSRTDGRAEVTPLSEVRIRTGVDHRNQKVGELEDLLFGTDEEVSAGQW